MRTNCLEISNNLQAKVVTEKLIRQNPKFLETVKYFNGMEHFNNQMKEKAATLSDKEKLINFYVGAATQTIFDGKKTQIVVEAMDKMKKQYGIVLYNAQIVRLSPLQINIEDVYKIQNGRVGGNRPVVVRPIGPTQSGRDGFLISYGDKSEKFQVDYTDTIISVNLGPGHQGFYKFGNFSIGANNYQLDADRTEFTRKFHMNCLENIFSLLAPDGNSVYAEKFDYHQICIAYAELRPAIETPLEFAKGIPSDLGKNSRYANADLRILKAVGLSIGDMKAIDKNQIPALAAQRLIEEKKKLIQIKEKFGVPLFRDEIEYLMQNSKYPFRQLFALSFSVTSGLDNFVESYAPMLKEYIVNIHKTVDNIASEIKNFSDYALN